MEIISNKNLKAWNSFSIAAKAKYATVVENLNDLIEAFDFAHESQLKVLLLGEGSNVLFTTDFDGLIIKNNFLGIEILENDNDKTVLRVGAGENWHSFVMWTLEKGFQGLENLTLIPGSVGAAPVQNIGAYGVEVKEFIKEVEVFDCESYKVLKLSSAECEFAYRFSRFKAEWNNKYVILSVIFHLAKEAELNTEYGVIREELDSKGIVNPTANDVSQVVTEIRQSKLPDPKNLGNAGSFFKNPVISIEQYAELKNEFPELPFYKVDKVRVKLPAAWLIEKAGLKGYRQGDCGVHEKQALVIVNFGSATGRDIKELSGLIQNKILELFSIQLEAEVRFN